MQLGMIGLGRMGANIVRRLIRDGMTALCLTSTQHRVVPGSRFLQ